MNCKDFGSIAPYTATPRATATRRPMDQSSGSLLLLTATLLFGLTIAMVALNSVPS